MKTLMILTVLSAFSFSTAAARACDGMRDHEKSADTQAKNENGKAAGKTKKNADKPAQQDNGTSKS
jgi:hypothetical protein